MNFTEKLFYKLFEKAGEMGLTTVELKNDMLKTNPGTNPSELS